MKKNILIWLIAIVLALSLWLQQRLLRFQQSEFEIPIKITNLNDDYKIIQKNYENTRWLISGKGLHLIFFAFSNVYALIDASDFSFGTNFIKENDEKLQLVYPKWLQLKYQRINENMDIAIDVDKIITVLKPVSQEFLKKPEFSLCKIKNEFKQVKVSGPMKKVNNISFIYTSFNNNQNTNHKIYLNLIKPDTDININPDKIEIIKKENKFFEESIPFLKISNPNNLNILPKNVSVILSGKNKQVFSKVKAYISKIKNKNTAEIKFDLPKDVKIIDYTPKNVRIIK